MAISLPAALCPLGSERVNGGATATYGYDDAGQLASVSGGPASGSWTYGTRGNRLTGTSGGVTTSYATNPNGSVAMATAGTRVSTFAYDDAGRVDHDRHRLQRRRRQRGRVRARDGGAVALVRIDRHDLDPSEPRSGHLDPLGGR